MKFFWFCIFISHIFSLQAANLPAKPYGIDSLSTQKKYFVLAEYQRLRSTHGSVFNGFNLVFSKKINTSNTVGLGLEYSWAPFHGDNGFNLFNLSFLPVFIDYRHYFFNDKKLNPFLVANFGYTFSGYEEEEDGKPFTRNRIKEGGIYLAGGFGLSYKICSNLLLTANLGFKGFHNTFNNLDINPHGIVLRSGISYHFK